MTIRGITKLLVISFLVLLSLGSANAKGRALDITIIPDKEEDYILREVATFDIEMTRRNKLANIKLKQIESTFPDEETEVTLTKVSKGKFRYVTGEFEKSGEKILSITVRTLGAVRSIENLERIKERLEKRIERLAELRENTENEKLKRLIDRLIAIYQRIIQRIENCIERIRQKGIIGEASCTITVIPIVWEETGLSSPVDVVVDKDRNVYVLESSANKVSIYNKDGDYLNYVGHQGWYNPKGIALDKDENLYIADTMNHRIMKLKRTDPRLFEFTLDSTFGNEGIAGEQGTDDGQFNQPWGIGVDSNGNVYVTDSGNNRIQKFDSAGKFVDKWGAQGAEEDQFNAPRGIFIYEYGYMYIADSQNNRIKEYDDNLPWNIWGELGSAELQVNNPADVAVDEYHIYVADSGNNRIQKYVIPMPRTGEIPPKPTILETCPLGLSSPQGIAIDSDLQKELIYVTDTGNGRLVKVEVPIVPPSEAWDVMKEALKKGDIETALESFIKPSKERYRQVFTTIAYQLPDLANSMQEIQLIYIRGDIAKYRIRREINGQEITFYIYFKRNEEGEWKIKWF